MQTANGRDEAGEGQGREIAICTWYAVPIDAILLNER